MNKLGDICNKVKEDGMGVVAFSVIIMVFISTMGSIAISNSKSNQQNREFVSEMITRYEKYIDDAQEVNRQVLEANKQLASTNRLIVDKQGDQLSNIENLLSTLTQDNVIVFKSFYGEDGQLKGYKPVKIMNEQAPK